MTSTEADIPSIEELIPHTGASVLLERVLTHDRVVTTVRVVAGGRSWMRRPDGSVAAWLAVEYMAQCVAAHEGMLARAERRRLPLGFLVSVTRLRLERAAFSRGECLRVSARRVRGRPGLGILSHRCEIFAESDPEALSPLAHGRLSIVVEGSLPFDRLRVPRVP